jgi:hypothetical protein
VARTDPASIAESLKGDPVYVEPGAEPGLSQAERGRVRLRIVGKDLGRIKIAVTRPETAQSVGGVNALANAIDAHLTLNGNLLVVAGKSAHLVTSYPNQGPALQGLREALNAKEGFTQQLLDSVDRLAAVDPGPRADGNRGVDSPRILAPDIGRTTDKVVGAAVLIAVIIALSILLPIAGVALWLLLRLRRNRADEAEELGEDLQAARDDLIALGEDIQALDLDVEMPGADAKGKSEYDLAVQAYGRAERELGRRGGAARRLTRARAALGDGRRRIEKAKQLLSGEPAAPAQERPWPPRPGQS